MSQFVASHRKAFAGGLLSAVAGYAAAAAAGGTWQTSVIAAVVAALGGGVGVSAIPNKAAKPQ